MTSRIENKAAQGRQTFIDARTTTWSLIEVFAKHPNCYTYDCMCGALGWNGHMKNYESLPSAIRELRTLEEELTDIIFATDRTLDAFMTQALFIRRHFEYVEDLCESIDELLIDELGKYRKREVA